MALLAQEQDLRIVGEARDGVEAVEKARELRPDVITMDVNMPRLDGLGATAAIMAESPARVLMVCAVSEDRQLDLSFRAMAAGALEVISKPGPAQDELHRFGRRVAEAVRLMAEVPVVRRNKGGHGAALRAGGGGVGAIGLVASTGGPPALSVVLRGLPAARRLRPGAGRSGPPAHSALERAPLPVGKPIALFPGPLARRPRRRRPS